MRNTFISKYVELVEKRHEFVAVAAMDIPENTVIEVSPVLMCSARAIIPLTKAHPSLETRVIIDERAVDKEYEIFTSLGEMELERRLNSGQISEFEYQQILKSKINLGAILDAKTHALPLGYSLLYGISDFPNMIREYDSTNKLCAFRTVQYIIQGTELTYSK